jgi:hypothetical protein
LRQRIRQQPTSNFGDAPFSDIRIEHFGEIALFEALTQFACCGARAERREFGARHGAHARRLIAIDKFCEQIIIRRRRITTA